MNENFILAVIDKFSSGKIGEIDLSLELHDGTCRLVLRRESRAAGSLAPTAGAGPDQNLAPQTEPAVHGEQNVHLGITAGISAGETITAPIVATFYAAPGPDAPPFVKPGSKVKPKQTLCVLEAMKMMNHLEAEFACEILEVHAKNGDLVEYGQALFTVKRL